MRETVFRPSLCAGLGLALLAGSACAQGARTPPLAPSILEDLYGKPVPSPYCNAWPAQTHIGRQATPTVGVAWSIEPGTGINGNFVEGRLLLGLDAHGTIVSAYCA